MANTYSTGTVSVATGSKIVTITGGLSISINMKPGDVISIGDGTLNAIDELLTATTFSLVTPHDGIGGAGQAYFVIYMPTGWGDRVELAEQTAELIRLIGQGIITSVNYQTRALLFADLKHAEGQLARVWGDANPAYIGVYKKSGASTTGSWTRIGDLPDNNAVEAISEEVTTVADNIGSVNTTANNIVAVNSAAANINSIIAAPGQAAAAQTARVGSEDARDVSVEARDEALIHAQAAFEISTGVVLADEPTAVAGLNDSQAMTPFTTQKAFNAFFGSKVLRLSSLGIKDGDNATVALQILLGSAGDDVTVIVDRSVTYTATAGVQTITHNRTLVFEGSGQIACPNLNRDGNAYFWQPTGVLIGALTANTAFPVENGHWYLRVLDTTGVQAGDLIRIRTDIYFNGIAGLDGSTPITVTDYGLVRSVDVGTSSILLHATLDFSIPHANIVGIDHIRACKNPKLINPNIIGPGDGGVLRPNGLGCRGFAPRYCDRPQVLGGVLHAWQGKAVVFDNSYDSKADGLHMESLKTERTTQSYYGVDTDGGKFSQVLNCSGRNIRRVADTDSNFLAIRVHHQNIHGELCNGSVAGTHQCYLYTFDGIHDSGSNTTLIIRGRETTGRGVYSRNATGNAVIIGPGVDVTDLVHSYGKVKISDIVSSGGEGGRRGGHINIYGNGEFDLSGDLSDADNKGIFVRAPLVRGFKWRGKMVAKGGDNIVIQGQRILENVDIQDGDLDGASGADISVSGSLDISKPARHVRIANNTVRSLLVSNIVLNAAGKDPGYFVGETVVVEGNMGTGGNGVNPVAYFSPGKFSAAPVVRENRKVRDVSLLAGSDRGDFIKMEIARVSALADLPAGLTVLDGDLVSMKNSAAGVYPSYECLFSGTVGVLAGITGTTTAGSVSVSLVGNTGGIMLGSFILIPGAGASVYRVTRVSADMATVDVSPAPASAVTGVAITYRNPIFKGYGLLQA